MDSSTHGECAEIAAAVGGDALLAQRTGSRAFERFTGPQIRKFFKRAPVGLRGHRPHSPRELVSRVSARRPARPVDPGDASGMNLMDLAARQLVAQALEATAPDLLRRLPAIVDAMEPCRHCSRHLAVPARLPAAPA